MAMRKMDLDKDYTKSSKFRSKIPNLVTLLDDRSRAICPPLRVERLLTEQRACMLDVSRRSTLEKYHVYPVTALDLEKPHERYLVSGSENGDLAIHDTWNFTKSPLFCAPTSSRNRKAHDDSISCVQWHQDISSTVVSSGEDKELKVWDLERGSMYLVLKVLFKHPLYSHHISPRFARNKLIAVGHNSPSLILVDSCTGLIANELPGHRVGVCNVKWSPTSDFLLASGDVGGQILLWDIRSTKTHLMCLEQLEEADRQIRPCPAHAMVDGMKFLDDGLSLVSYIAKGYVRLWDVQSGKKIPRDFGYPLTNNSPTPLVIDICWSGSVPLLYVPCNFHILVYDLVNGTRIRHMRGHTGLVTGCVFSSNTCEMFSAGKDKKIIKWTVNKVSNIKKISHEACVWIP